MSKGLRSTKARYPDLDLEHLDQWLRALDSGAYQQITNVLHVALKDDSWGYCCLGVGCKVSGLKSVRLEPSQTNNDFDADLPIYGYEGTPIPGSTHAKVEGEPLDVVLDQPPREFNAWLGLPSGSLSIKTADGVDHLYVLNDDWRLTFGQIADCIRYFGLHVAQV